MTPQRAPHQQTPWRSWPLNVIAILAVFVVLLLLDRTFYHILVIAPDDLARKKLEENDWHQMIRAAGYLPTWVTIGVALFLQAIYSRLRSVRQSPPRRFGAIHAALEHRNAWAGPLIILSASFSGIAAEVLKPVIGRLRPIQTDGLQRFHGLADDLTESAAYGLPSSHAAIAFGAAFMVRFFWPGAGLIALIAAMVCGFSRTLTGAHFVTDVFVAAVLAYAIARVLYPSGWPRNDFRVAA